MTTGEARVLETDAIIFSTDLEETNIQENLTEKTSNEIKLGEGTKRPDVESRFTRLKKSLRRRSVSIL